MSATTVHPALQAALDLAQVALEEHQAAERDCFLHAATKAVVRSGAIQRIMKMEAPSGKPHSWSSAEALRDTDQAYLEFKTQEAKLSALRAQKEFELWVTRQTAEYLARVLPGAPDLSSYNCLHGIPMGEECACCDSGQELVK